ncbi:Palmitoyltransferase ZDHHC11 (DHHC domain-containing protein 11) (Zinc finger DHHC domain-containing protein 11), partial [Durusdinium trenchii]
ALRHFFLFAIHLEALVAVLCLLGLMWGDPGVVRRSRSNALPIPPPAQEALQVGQSIEGLQNIKEGEDMYCVRCCVWRRHGDSSKPTWQSSKISWMASFCCDDGMSNFHHCSTCQRCVANFDHHCGVFGRCIAGRGFGGNMGFFKTIIAMAMAGAVTCFASVIVLLIKQEEGSLLAVILLAYMTPVFLGCCVLLCSMMWPETLALNSKVTILH